jgi:zinc/manganese transport system ATP-binding protein
LSAISLDAVTLAIAGRTILSDIDLDIAEGEFIGVLGPNGSGKTTLLKALLGLLLPAAGIIRVFGESPRGAATAIGYLPQARSAPPATIAGYDLLAAAVDGERWGPSLVSAASRRCIDEALVAVDGSALAERPLTAMSGGERQRLLIAQALIGNPRLLLLDEPLIGLDPYQQETIVDLVRRLCRERGITVLFTAHELNQVLRAVDRILYLGHGHAALGTVAEVVRPDVLSRLYGAPIEVVRAGGHVFVMSHGQDIERDHSHDHDNPHDHTGHPHAGPPHIGHGHA